MDVAKDVGKVLKPSPSLAKLAKSKSQTQLGKDSSVQDVSGAGSSAARPE
jgi:hypothetical protein